ncbi:microprocessor complex subunit DGCR8-like [Argonauta hians]
METTASPSNADDDEAQNSKDENCLKHILSPSTQTSNLTNNKRLYFDSDDGRKNDIDYGCPSEKRPRISTPVSGIITCVENYLDCDRESRLPSGEHSAQTSHEFEIIDDIELDDDGVGTDISVRSYISNGQESLDLSTDEDNDDDEDDDEEYLDDNEVYAWLEEGVDSRKSGSDGELKDDGPHGPIEVQKIVLKERGHDPFDILPEGWIIVTHNSGMPVYLHKESRVCTLSKPYFLGPGSARKHDIPVSAIPCLHYSRELQKESQQGTPKDIEPLTITDIECTNGQDSDEPQLPIKSDFPVTSDNDSDGMNSNQECNTGPIDLDDNSKTPAVKIECAEERKKENSLDPLELRKYCEKRFEFKKITVKKFKTWKERRRHMSLMKKQSRPALPSNTKLITCPVPASKGDDKVNRRREFVLNPSGKSYVCILHEYVQHTMRVQPRYIFREVENAQTPYSATIVINDVEYGTGFAGSKKAAKMEAAKATLKVLIPEMNKMTEDNKSYESEDLSFFDEIKIEDPRVYELCNKAGQPTPYQILLECLRRNYGMGDTQCQMEMKTLKHQKSEFTMTVGKHKASVVCKNKREGKQQAAQAILQRLHPHITSWGSLLRLYGRISFKIIREKKEEEQSITELQSQAKSNKPNTAVLEKLREEMRKIKLQRESIKSRGKLRLESAVPVGNVSGLDL